ncbi:hypothetical protein [Prochlorothrix hollandica]|uniref:hypothetical protein n=1 Tax=Prochlorothrix hollandica TaxID=1223 RepID=UPI0033406ACB
MALTNSQGLEKTYSLMIAQSFLTWVFTLAVCSLVIGFPILILVVTIGALLMVTLQSMFSMSAALVIAASILGIHILGIVATAAILTFRGIHPQDVTWLAWLNGRENSTALSVYAACPLTCDITTP